jgi:hypothetical protein
MVVLWHFPWVIRTSCGLEAALASLSALGQKRDPLPRQPEWCLSLLVRCSWSAFLLEQRARQSYDGQVKGVPLISKGPMFARGCKLQRTAFNSLVPDPGPRNGREKMGMEREMGRAGQDGWVVRRSFIVDSQNCNRSNQINFPGIIDE